MDNIKNLSDFEIDILLNLLIRLIETTEDDNIKRNAQSLYNTKVKLKAKESATTLQATS